MAPGGENFCDGCGWHDCLRRGACLRHVMTLSAALDWMHSAPVFIGIDLSCGPDLSSPVVEPTLANALATVVQTGAGEHPAIASGLPATPLRSGGGMTSMNFAFASPFKSGTSNPSPDDMPSLASTLADTDFLTSVGESPVVQWSLSLMVTLDDGVSNFSTAFAFPSTSGTTC